MTHYDLRDAYKRALKTTMTDTILFILNYHKSYQLQPFGNKFLNKVKSGLKRVQVLFIYIYQSNIKILVAFTKIALLSKERMN